VKSSIPSAATAAVSAKLKIPAKTLAIWTAMLLTTAMLLVLYHT
jgi:hypothetical protein